MMALAPGLAGLSLSANSSGEMGGQSSLHNAGNAIPAATKLHKKSLSKKRVRMATSASQVGRRRVFLAGGFGGTLTGALFFSSATWVTRSAIIGDDDTQLRGNCQETN